MRLRSLSAMAAAVVVPVGAGAGVGLPQPPSAYAAASPFYVDPDTNAAHWVAANPADPTVSVANGWNGTWSQSGTTVTVRNVAWNGGLPSGGTVSTGFQASFSGSNPPLAAFALNGSSCGS
jgi:hypothetical protein